MSSQCAKASRDLAMRRLVGRAQILQRRVGEDDAPAERVERPIALENADGPRGEAPLDQYAEIEAGGAAADACDAHK